jgi:hypothetical protein
LARPAAFSTLLPIEVPEELELPALAESPLMALARVASSILLLGLDWTPASCASTEGEKTSADKVIATAAGRENL